MIPALKKANVYPWRFFRAGGFDQVKLETGADLMNLDKLDQKLWVALACPTTGLEFDPKTLSLVDTDKDSRIRAPELIAAVKWAGDLLKNPDDLVKGGDSVPFAAINDATAEGKQLLASARQIVENLGNGGATAISIADASDANKIFANTTLNGDGVIIPESASDEATRAVINDIIACMSAVPDRSGKPGIDQGKTDAFFAACAAFDAWTRQAEADAANLLPAGAGTAGASAAVKAIKAKVDDFFGRCRLAAFDSRATALLNRKEEEYLALASGDLTITATEVAGFPLAQVAPGKGLPLTTGLNPAHAAAVANLQASAIQPLLGERAELTEKDWATLQARLAAFDAWTAGKAGAVVEKLGIERVRQLLDGKMSASVTALIAKDKALEPEATAIAQVEKLVRFVRDLHSLCENFVNFRDLYDDGDPAIFQCGVLYLDQRSCNLCLPVDDVARHATMASLAGAYLAYCDCVRKATGEKKTIVAIFSQGDDDNLMVGRNGLFYDRKGRDWDATITKIVSNPISLRQAFWLPYKKFVRMIEEQISKRAAAADADASNKLAAAAAATANADKAKPVEPKKVDVGTVAALGVAFGAIGAFVTGMATGIVKVATFGPLAIVGLVVGVILLISGPSLILAYIKLRKRNLGPILDANGWAVNAKAKINVPFGTALTQIAKLPPGAERDLTDPFAEKKNPWPKLIGLALALYVAYAILNHLGFIYDWTGGRMGVKKDKAATGQTTTDTATTSDGGTNATTTTTTTTTTP